MPMVTPIRALRPGKAAAPDEYTTSVSPVTSLVIPVRLPSRSYCIVSVRDAVAAPLR